MYVDHARNAVA